MKMLGQPICSLLQEMSKFQRSPFCICFSWDKAGSSWTSLPALVTAAKCQHPVCPHLCLPCFQHPTRRKFPFLQKMRNLSLHKVLFLPGFGAWQLQPAPAARGDVAELEGRCSDLIVCHGTASAITLNRLGFLFAFNKINRKWHPIKHIKTLRLQITHFSLGNGGFMLPHSLYSALPGLWHVFSNSMIRPSLPNTWGFE